MKVLHLFSNARWTGPAEPALNLCVALREAGVEADFACPANAPGSAHTLLETARDRGIQPFLGLRLNKHAKPIANWLDAAALRSYLKTHPHDLIHCHLDNDHRIAVAANKRAGLPIVRSSYEGGGFQNKEKLHRKLLAATHHFIEPAQAALDYDAKRYGYPRDKMTVIPGAIDVERFDPTRQTPDARRWLGIPHDAFVIGIVARMQPHRRYEVLLDAIRRLTEQVGNVHLIVVGRGTRQETVAKQPARELGLEDRVHFPGYVAGENYVGMLNAFDVKVFLVPGSDGTCRAVREAMAMGKPIVAANRGMLAEIVDNEQNGFVIDDTPEALAQALHQLATNRAHTRAMGHAARKKARTLFSLQAQAQATIAVYQSLLDFAK